MPTAGSQSLVWVFSRASHKRRLIIKFALNFFYRPKRPRVLGNYDSVLELELRKASDLKKKGAYCTLTVQ